MNSKDITSKSKPTPENPITLHVSLTQRDGRIVRVGTLAMAVGGMSSSVRAQDAHQQPSKVFGLRQSLSSTKPGQLHRCSFFDCRRRPAGDETTIHFDGWSACRTSGLPTPQFRADHGLCGSWVLVPVPQRGLVLCKAQYLGFGPKASIFLPWAHGFPAPPSRLENVSSRATRNPPAR